MKIARGLPILLLIAFTFTAFFNACSPGFDVRSKAKAQMLKNTYVFPERTQLATLVNAATYEDLYLEAQLPQDVEAKVVVPLSLYCSQTLAANKFKGSTFSRAGNPVAYLYDENRVVQCSNSVFSTKEKIEKLRLLSFYCSDLKPNHSYFVGVLNSARKYAIGEILPGNKATNASAIESGNLVPGNGPRLMGPQIEDNLILGGATITTNSLSQIEGQTHWAFLMYSSYPGPQQNYYDKYDSRLCTDPSYNGGAEYWRLYPKIPGSVLVASDPPAPTSESCKLYQGPLGGYTSSNKDETYEGSTASSVVGSIGASLILPEPPQSSQNCDGMATPLIVDFSKREPGQKQYLSLTPVDSGIFFDIMGALSPRGLHQKLKISWLRSPDYFWLVKPVNETVNGIDEMFGDNTRGPDGRFAAHGYQALAKWDANRDGIIDASDAVFMQLAFWSDRNLNGITDPNEVISLSRMGVTYIDLRYDKQFIERDQYGNETRMRSVVGLKDGSQRLIFDLWFKIRGD